MPNRRFTNRIILVTGASSGFGLAMTRAFVAEGAAVAMAARNPDRLALAAAEGAVGLALILALFGMRKSLDDFSPDQEGG